MENLGNKIKQERKAKKLTQPQLAKLIGVSNGIISQWENDEYEPKATYLKKIAIALNVSADYLLGLEDDFGNKTYINNSFNNNHNSNITIGRK